MAGATGDPTRTLLADRARWVPGPAALVVATLLFLAALGTLSSAGFEVVVTDDDTTDRYSQNLPDATTQLALWLAGLGPGIAVAGTALPFIRREALILSVALAASLAAVAVHAWATLDTLGQLSEPKAYTCASCVVDEEPDGGLTLGTFSAVGGTILLVTLAALDLRRSRGDA